MPSLPIERHRSLKQPLAFSCERSNTVEGFDWGGFIALAIIVVCVMLFGMRKRL